MAFPTQHVGVSPWVSPHRVCLWVVMMSALLREGSGTGSGDSASASSQPGGTEITTKAFVEAMDTAQTVVATFPGNYSAFSYNTSTVSGKLVRLATPAAACSMYSDTRVINALASHEFATIVLIPWGGDCLLQTKVIAALQSNASILVVEVPLGQGDARNSSAAYAANPLPPHAYALLPRLASLVVVQVDTTTFHAVSLHSGARLSAATTTHRDGGGDSTSWDSLEFARLTLAVYLVLALVAVVLTATILLARKYRHRRWSRGDREVAVVVNGAADVGLLREEPTGPTHDEWSDLIRRLATVPYVPPSAWKAPQRPMHEEDAIGRRPRHVDDADGHVTTTTVTLKPGEDGSDEALCCICIADFQRHDRLCVLPCKHTFHKDCIGRWLHGNRGCPLCKMDVYEAMNESTATAEMVVVSTSSTPNPPPPPATKPREAEAEQSTPVNKVRPPSPCRDDRDMHEGAQHMGGPDATGLGLIDRPPSPPLLVGHRSISPLQELSC
eukprot:m.178871 g.178871  ORF g.178871 m.178871 type:complete len:499 (+) comp14643_c0_seq1:113-1609(+)